MNTTKHLIFAAVFFAALCLISCDREKENKHEYPATADVILNAVKDVDGNQYDAVRIGNQVWMAENLKTTHYADGTEIPLAGEHSCSDEHPFLYYPWYANMVRDFGYLYNWSAMIHNACSSDVNPSGVQGICPQGWHVPSDAEWMQLTDYLESQPMYAKQIAKSLASKEDWTCSENENAIGNATATNNATGFSARPAGWGYGGYVSIYSFDAFFWSVSLDNDNNAQGFHMHTDSTDVMRVKCAKHAAFSVRCLRD